jgi:imidazolonepropionase
MSILITNARVVTPTDQPGLRRGRAMEMLYVVDEADVLVREGSIAMVEPASRGLALSRDVPRNTRVIDAQGRVLLPGFVDCHTHACWAGSRLDEWQMKLRGATYQQIMASGGGILSTVRATRAASRDELASLLRQRLGVMLAHGTTTAEVKSGYGLSLEAETKMLGAIADASRVDDAGPLPYVIPTALLGHAIDPEEPDFVANTIRRTLHEVATHHRRSDGGPLAVDAFCEAGAWSVEQCVDLFESAKVRNMPVRVHVDQFSSIGMVQEAIRLGAVSCDHLEASGEGEFAALGKSETAAVILPACGFHLDGRYAKGRALVDAGAGLAIATNFNPGSAPVMSMPFVVALAVRYCGLRIAEAIHAATVNAAHVLGLRDRGAIAPGMRADMILLRHRDERELAYEVGGNCVDVVVAHGRVVSAGGV